MMQILDVTSAGPEGPVLIVFSREPIASTEPAEDEYEVVIDFDAMGQVVEVELVSVNPETLGSLVSVAKKHDLDLRGLFAWAAQPHAA